MDAIKQFGIILGINYLGDVIQHLFNLPMPGNVIGFVILFILLSFKILKVEDIEKIVGIILINLSFLFIPSGASLLTVLDILKDTWFQLSVICVISTIITMVVTGWVVQIFLKEGDF